MCSFRGGVTYYSLRYSMQFVDIFDGSAVESVVWETRDSVWLHFIVVIAFIAIIFAVDMLLKKCADVEKCLNGLLYIVMAASLVSCLIWVLGGNFYARNDSRSVLDCVSRIRSGDFSDLLPTGYLGAYQNQLGIAAIFQFFFFVLRTDDDIALQVVNALCVPCIIFAGNGFLKEVNCRRVCRICYLVSMMFCFPLLFYTPYVYGEIISVTAGSFFIWAAVCYIKRGKTSSWIALIVSAVIGNMARGNFPVLLIAFAIVAILYSIRRKKMMPVICVATVILATLAGNKAVYTYYEYISGIELNQGIPLEGWIAMGLNDEAPASGMYNGYNGNIYAKYNCNKEAARRESRAYIHDRWFMLSGGGWRTFFKEKLLVQWNDPTLTCFIENHSFNPEPAIPVIGEIMLDEGKYYKTAVELMNQYQFLIYLGVVFYCIAAFRCKEPFYQLLPLIVILGGCFFTLIWEAMARYVFPYFIYMEMLSAMGYGYVETLLGRGSLYENR